MFSQKAKSFTKGNVNYSAFILFFKLHTIMLKICNSHLLKKLSCRFLSYVPYGVIVLQSFRHFCFWIYDPMYFLRFLYRSTFKAMFKDTSGGEKVRVLRHLVYYTVILISSLICYRVALAQGHVLLFFHGETKT